jgi:hypothetical protein
MIQLFEKRLRSNVTSQGGIVKQTTARGVENHARGTEEAKAFEQVTGGVITGRDINPDQGKGFKYLADSGIA